MEKLLNELRAMIDGLRQQQAVKPTRENAISLTYLETGLLWLEASI